MRRFLFCLALLMIGAMSLSAQTATPARPVDPHQPLPAQPVQPTPMPSPVVSASATNAPAANAPAETPAQPTLTVMAESSLRTALQELLQNWADSLDSGPKVALTLTNSGTIFAKVEAGTDAPSAWDVVIDADIEDVKAMTDKGFLRADAQRPIARNSLVVFGRKALLKDDQLDWFDLVGSEWKKVAMGNPDLVASGRLAKSALQKHGLFGDEHKNIYIYAGTEADALKVVYREEADAVFLYKTDLAGVAAPGFEALALSDDDAPPVFYVASVCRQAKNPQLARAFIEYCMGDEAKAVWTKYGFETD